MVRRLAGVESYPDGVGSTGRRRGTSRHAKGTGQLTRPFEIRRLDGSSLGDMAALCARAVPDPPKVEELGGALFAPEQPADVRGDPEIGVVATVECDGGAHLRLIAVEPSARRRGYGRALLESAEQSALSCGHGSLTVGADPPYFLWPGVPSGSTELLCLLESRHYSRVEANFDMTVALDSIPAEQAGPVVATADERDEVDLWMAEHWPNWRLEVLRALEKGNLLLEREQSAGRGPISAFCAFEVNRGGKLGPVGVRPDLIGRGRGRGVLVGALHELRRRGRERVDIVWVGPVVPYASVGGAISNVYFVYRRELG